MKTKILSKTSKVLLIMAAVVGPLNELGPTPTRANTIALDFAAPPTGVVWGNLTFGWAFSLSSAVLVTHLGLWDGNNRSALTPPGDGFLQPHPVIIWTSAGSVVTSAVLPVGMSGTLVDDFRYISIAPTVLAPGDYVIGAHYRSFDLRKDYSVLSASGITTEPEVIYQGSRSI